MNRTSVPPLKMWKREKAINCILSEIFIFAIKLIISIKLTLNVLLPETSVFEYKDVTGIFKLTFLVSTRRGNSKYWASLTTDILSNVHVTVISPTRLWLRTPDCSKLFWDKACLYTHTHTHTHTASLYSLFYFVLFKFSDVIIYLFYIVYALIHYYSYNI